MSESGGTTIKVGHPLIIAPSSEIVGEQKSESNKTVVGGSGTVVLSTTQQVIEYLKALYK